MARAYAGLKNFDKVVEIFSKLIELYPESPSAYLSRGIAYGQLGEYERVAEDFNRVLDLEIEDAERYFCKAYIYAMSGKSKDACDWLAQAIERDEDFRERAR